MNRLRRARFCAWLVCLGCLAWAGWAWAAQAAPLAPDPVPGPAAAAADFPFALPYLETIGDSESIPDGTVSALAQDARGLVWIGTQHGLVRYDGYRFRRFVHDANDPTSLAGDYVASLWAAGDGRIWVGGNSDGLSVFDPGSERFTRFAHDPKRPNSLAAGRIWALLGDAQGGLWIAAEHGLDYLAKNSMEFIHYRHDNANPGSLLDDKVRRLLLTREGRLLVGCARGLQRLAQDGKGFEHIAGATADAGQEDKAAGAINVQSLFEAQDGKLWIGTAQHGAAWLAPNSRQLHWLALKPAAPAPAQKDAVGHAWITGIAQVRGQIWLASYGGGIDIVAAGDGRVLQHLRHDPALPGGLALDMVYGLMRDRAGMLWIGTWGGGLQRHNGNNGMARLVRHQQTSRVGLSHPHVTSVLELANGQILFGSIGNGIDVFDRQRGLVAGHRADRGVGALPDATVHAMLQATDGSLWAGTRQAGAVRMPPGGHEWRATPGLPANMVNCLLRARDGVLWAGTNFGLARWQDGRTRFEVVADEHGKPMQGNVRALAEDGQGRVWVGGNYGLWVLEPGGTGLRRIRHEPERADSLASDAITGLLIDSHQRLWAATGKGLDRLPHWDGKTARFEHVSAMLGRPGKNLGANLLEDRVGRIWTGEAVIDPAKMQMAPLTRADGIDIGTGWNGAYGQTRDGLMLFGGTQGVAVIDPGLFRAWDYAPPLVATELKINGKTAPLGAAAMGMQGGGGQAPPLTLAPEQRTFAVEFAALDFSDPKKNRYQYRLQGYDKTWIDTDSEHRSAGYGNLWPGMYTLQVRGSNRLGDWSPHELAIPILVLPAWYQTWWFVLSMLIALAAAVAELVQVRTRYLRRRQRELEQQVQQRTLDLQRKQQELLAANQNLNNSNEALNWFNNALNQANSDVNQANSDVNQANSDLNQANDELQLSVETLRQLGDIGRDITANLDEAVVFQALYVHVSGLLDTQTLSIYCMNDATGQLDMMFGREDDAPLPGRSVALDSPTSNVARAARGRQEVLRELEADAASPNHIPGTRKMRTALFAPLIVDERVLGVMSIQSAQERAYGERERLIFRTLCAYGAIALANAEAVTALRQAQAQLVQQEKMASLGTLTAGIAHEINNPCNFTYVGIFNLDNEIKQFKAFLFELAGDDAPKEILASIEKRFGAVNAHVKSIREGAVRIRDLVKDLRSFSGIDEAAWKAVAIGDCLLSTVNLVRAQYAKSTEIRCELAANPILECWPAELNQVFMNVIVNACQAIAQQQQQKPDYPHGLLCIRSRIDDGQLILEFEDNGGGIPQAALGQIFDPFFTTKDVGSGIGLGLSISFGIIGKHNGHIKVDTTAGKGSCFRIYLPLPGHR